jgi:hypothetical protein
LLDALELEVADDKSARSDLLQLRALCAAADSEAFLPISSEEASDQRTPALILQLNSIVQASVDRAVTKGILNLKRTNPQASTQRIGRYAWFGAGRQVAPWLGIHFGLWKKHGDTPLWVVFAASKDGRAAEVRSLLEPWAAQQRVFTTTQEDDSFVVPLDIPLGEDKDKVVAGIVARLEEMAGCLAVLGPRPEGDSTNG